MTRQTYATKIKIHRSDQTNHDHRYKSFYFIIYMMFMMFEIYFRIVYCEGKILGKRHIVNSLQDVPDELSYDPNRRFNITYLDPGKRILE